MRIDINSDTGESFGAYTIGHDAGLFRSITSANVAAGFHAGDDAELGMADVGNARAPFDISAQDLGVSRHHGRKPAGTSGYVYLLS